MLRCSCLRRFLIRVLISLGVLFADRLGEVHSGVANVWLHVNAHIAESTVAAAEPQEDTLIVVFDERAHCCDSFHW